MYGRLAVQTKTFLLSLSLLFPPQNFFASFFPSTRIREHATPVRPIVGEEEIDGTKCVLNQIFAERNDFRRVGSGGGGLTNGCFSYIRFSGQSEKFHFPFWHPSKRMKYAL